jgi:hypothetical protein
MDDEIKVTVIATGFDSGSASDAATACPSVANGGGAGGAMHFPAEDGNKEEDLDVPTFIRRQAD